MLCKLQQVSQFFQEYSAHVSGSGKEELFSIIRPVHAMRREVLVQLVLKTHGVFRKENCVYVETEWDRRVSKFVDAI